MRIIRFLKNLLWALYRSIRRFPVTLLLCAAATFLMMVMVHQGNSMSADTRDTLTRIIMILALGVPLTLCTALLLEKFREKAAWFSVIAYGITGLLLAVYYFLLLQDLHMVSITRYIAVSLALYLAFICLPYLPRREGFALYGVKLLSHFFTTFLYSVVLFMGISAILFTLDQLLGVPVTSRTYYDFWLLVVGIYAPTFFLGGVPQYDQELEPTDYSRLFKFLLLYVVMPVIGVYTVILYIYFAKILITRQWPQGMVGHLVLWYAIITTLVLFFITPVREENRWAALFIRFFPKLLLPLLAIMFVSLGIRIRAYGLTENRYFVLAAGLWATGSILYLSFRKQVRSIVLPTSLAIIALLSVLGPWSSYSLSMWSQNQRLDDILRRNQMLSDGNILPSTSEKVNGKDKNEISQILSYFERNHALSDIPRLPKGFTVNDMEKVFGFTYQQGTLPGTPTQYFSYNADTAGASLDIKGYDYMIDSRSINRAREGSQAPVYAKYDNNTCRLELFSGDTLLYEKDLKIFGEELYIKLGDITKDNVPVSDMTFVDKNDNVEVKLIFYFMYGERMSSTDRPIIRSIDFYVLVKQR